MYSEISNWSIAKYLGLPIAISYMALVFVPYNDMVLGYTGAYVFGAVYTSSEGCNKYWNAQPACIPYSKIKRRGNNFPNSSVWLERPGVRTGLLSSELYFRYVYFRKMINYQSLKFAIRLRVFLVYKIWTSGQNFWIFRQYILTQQWSGENNYEFEGWNPKLFCGLGFAYFVVFLSTMDYLTSGVSKVR